jgi:hypothetical protein
MPKMEGNQQLAFIMHVFSLMFATTHNAWRNVKLGAEWAPWLKGAQAMLFVGGKIRAMDVALQLEKSVLNLRFMEQNPDKMDNMGALKENAIRARRGEQIMWVLKTNTDPNTWLGSVQNGQWIQGKQRPVYNAMPAGAANTGAAQTVPQDNNLHTYQGESIEIEEDDYINVNELPEVENLELAKVIIGEADYPYPEEE